MVQERLTVIGNKVISIPKGENIYLGREGQVVDIEEKGFSHLREIQGVLTNLIEDASSLYLPSNKNADGTYPIAKRVSIKNIKKYKPVINKKTLDKRLKFLRLIVLKDNSFNALEKEDAIKMINNVRTRFDLKPLKFAIKITDGTYTKVQIINVLTKAEKKRPLRTEFIKENIVTLDAEEDSIFNELITLKKGTEIWYNVDDRYEKQGSDWEEDYFLRVRKYMGRKRMKAWEDVTEDSIIPKSLSELKETHKLLGRLKETKPEKIFWILQASNWAKNYNNVNKYLIKKGIRHTSMMVGDIIITGKKGYITLDMGFLEFDISPEFNKKQYITIKPLSNKINMKAKTQEDIEKDERKQAEKRAKEEAKLCSKLSDVKKKTDELRQKVQELTNKDILLNYPNKELIKELKAKKKEIKNKWKKLESAIKDKKPDGNTVGDMAIDLDVLFQEFYTLDSQIEKRKEINKEESKVIDEEAKIRKKLSKKGMKCN